MLSIAIVAAIAVAIYLGYKTKINTGLFCIVFAYIIGCFDNIYKWMTIED